MLHELRVTVVLLLLTLFYLLDSSDNSSMQLTSPEDELAIRDIEKQLLSIESMNKSKLAHSPVGGGMFVVLD